MINIFGTGRSGTKAIQLFIAYILAKKFKTIKLNYESYLYCNRELNISYEGINHHINTPFFSKEISDFTKKHNAYLKKLEKNSKVIVNKFIRASGRIYPINQITKPNYNLSVIRDLDSTLRSIQNKNWNFYSIAPPYIKNKTFNYYHTMVDDAYKNGFINKLEAKLGNSLNSSIERNTFCWYLFNISILQTKIDNLYIFDFNKIHDLDNWTSKFLGNEKFSIAKFKGKDLLENKYFNSTKSTSKLEYYSQEFNEYLFNLGLRNIYLSRNIGDIVKIKNHPVNEIKNQTQEINKNIYYHFTQQEWVKDLSVKVNEKLQSRKYR